MQMFRGLIQWYRYERPGSVTVTLVYRNGDKHSRTFRRERWIEAWDDAHAWAERMHEKCGYRLTHSIL